MNHPIDWQLELMLQGRFEEARQISDDLEIGGPENIPVIPGKTREEMWLRHNFNRGWFLLQEGDYKKGSQCLEAGRFIQVYGDKRLSTTAPIWDSSQHNLRNKSIILSLEGGLGDQIIHSRFATKLKDMGARHVCIAASSELHTLLRRIEGVDSVITRDQVNSIAHDYWLPGFSAGWACGYTYENLPSDAYLSADPESIANVWKSIIVSDKIKIGIRWAGNPKFEHQQFRKFPPEFLTQIAQDDRLQLYSLQRDDNLITLPKQVMDLQHLLISWEDTAAAISQLDLIITSCTSVAHLAAALGKETWVVVPMLPYHIWAKGAPHSSTSPYYKSVRVFRQKTPDKWNETFQELYKALGEKFSLGYKPNHLPSCDKVVKRLNLGCGNQKHTGFTNVDIRTDVNADQIVDLDQFPWPWQDGEFSHIVAKDILEHLGSSPKDLVKIIQEMYRISNNGAVWEVLVPHWRCDNAVNDPTHVRVITPGTFKLFDRKLCLEQAIKGFADSQLAITSKVDIELCDTQFEYTDLWAQRLRTGQITQEGLIEALNSLNNVAQSTRMLIQVHKPGREL